MLDGLMPDGCLMLEDLDDDTQTEPRCHAFPAGRLLINSATH